MKIQKLELRHFGKFRDRTILLGDGIQLLYGEEYGLEIQSVYNRGTTITAELPYREEGEDV